LRDLRPIALGEETKNGVPSHDLKESDGDKSGKQWPRRSQRQLIHRDKQVVQEVIA
jgi:hypothetical protein